MNFRAYVINLRSATERWDLMQRRLRAAAIPFTRVEATYGRDLTLPLAEFDETAHRRQTGRRPIVNEIGCYLSHIEALRTFLRSGEPYGLILEDDAIFDRSLVEAIELAQQYQPQWDILRLSTVNNDRTLPIIPLNDQRSLGVSLTRSKGAAAYVVSRHAAETFVEKLLPMSLAYDIAYDLEFRFGLKAAFVTPFPVEWDRQLETQIQVNIHEYKYSALRYLTVFPFRVRAETERFFHRAWQAWRLRMAKRPETQAVPVSQIA